MPRNTIFKSVETHMCRASKSFLRISVAMAVAMPNCIGVAASVQARVICWSPQPTGEQKKQPSNTRGGAFVQAPFQDEEQAFSNGNGLDTTIHVITPSDTCLLYKFKRHDFGRESRIRCTNCRGSNFQEMLRAKIAACSRVSTVAHKMAHFGVHTGQLGPALLSDDKDLNVFALLGGAGHHLLDRARHERVDTLRVSSHSTKGRARHSSRLIDPGWETELCSTVYVAIGQPCKMYDSSTTSL